MSLEIGRFAPQVLRRNGMVSFDPTSYGLRLSFVGGTSAQNVSDCIADTGGHFASMPKGWRLLVDVREAPLPEVGRFARVHDPESNAIELWEPAPD
jgi:hypothetical protein